MAEHQKKRQKKTEDADQKRRPKPQEHQTSHDDSHAWGQDQVAIAETPFWPRIEKHAELLSMPHSDEQRANLVMHLQQTYGNRYVQRLIESMGVQAKLTVNDPNDVYEQEADSIAQAVSNRLPHQIQRQEEEEPEEGEVEIQTKSVLQRQVTDTIPEVSSDIEDKINRARGGGESLDTTIREPMEQAFGANFSGVRVHSDESADALNQSLKARAFTTGQDIFFRSGEFNPASSTGQQLLAHELTHTIQQTGKKKPEDKSVQIGQSSMSEELAHRAAVKEAPPVPTSKPWKKKPPPVPTSRPWKEKPSDKTAPVKIQDLAESGEDLGSSLKKADLINVANFAEGIRNVAETKGKKGVIDILGYVSTGAGYAAKGVGFVVEKVKGALKEGSAGAGVLNAVKKILGPIPYAINTVINIIKVIYAAATKKTKEAWEAVWETVKSAVSTVFSTVKMVFSLISKLGGFVPIVGDIADGVNAIISFIEAAYGTAKRILKWISINKLISKITGILQGSDEEGRKKEEGKGKKERMEYIYDINIKRRKNIKRQLAEQFTGIIASGAKLVAAVLGVVGGIVAMGGVTSPVGAVISAFGKVASIFGTVISTMGKLATIIPKVGHKIRQVGRDITAKIAKKEGKFSKWLAKGLTKIFDVEKSSEKKKEKLKEVVTGLVDDASGLKTEFNPAGKDRAALIEEVKAEVPKFDALDFELEAMGVDKGDLYKLNKEKSLGKRLKGQIKLIYSGLKGR